MRRFLLVLALVLVVAPALLLILGWSSLALHFGETPDSSVRTGLAWVFAIGWPLAFAALRNRRRTAVCFLLACGGVALWWSTLLPSARTGR